MSLISIAQAKGQLNIDTDSFTPSDAADAHLLLLMTAAEQIILNYLKVPVTSPEYWDSTTVPPEVQWCILYQLGELHRFRGDDTVAPQRNPYRSLHPMVEGILERYRDPALA